VSDNTLKHYQLSYCL